MEALDTLLNELHQAPKMPGQASLYGLSNLEASDVARLHKVWACLPVPLRQQITTRLAELAEADFEVNFNEVFRLGLADEDAQVRTSAVEGLWEDEDVSLVPLLIARLRKDENATVRAAAATSLGRFILLGELGKIHSDFYAPAYNALLAVYQGEEAVDVRRRALESLAYAESETVADLIREAYAVPEEKMRISVVFAMGRNADTCWAKHVQQELFKPNPELRYEAARACGEIELREAVPELGELTDDVDPEVQDAALWALGQIGGDKARKILERCCKASNEATRTAAEAALQELDFARGDLSEFITRLIHDRGDDVESD